jgi:hypothetical protein
MSADEREGRDEISAERLRARGIVAMGRVQRDADGFTVYSTATPPEPFRVWEDPHVGMRCTCDPFGRAFRAGLEYECEHLAAVALLGELPGGEEGPAAPAPGSSRDRLRQVM